MSSMTTITVLMKTLDRERLAELATDELSTLRQFVPESNARQDAEFFLRDLIDEKDVVTSRLRTTRYVAWSLGGDGSNTECFIAVLNHFWKSLYSDEAGSIFEPDQGGLTVMGQHEQDDAPTVYTFRGDGIGLYVNETPYHLFDWCRGTSGINPLDYRKYLDSRHAKKPADPSALRL